MTKKILITGGPVHAHLDAVKVITNRFRGGLMSELAEKLVKLGAEVTYLCAPSVGAQTPKDHERVRVVTHTGFDDYHKQVLELAPMMDAVVLGAAVANLIPVNPWKGKFPSHDYKPGDIIPIDFTIAPRVIDEVKRVAPHTHLFGYKLLSGVTRAELINAAYGIVLEAKATAVFANDASNLQEKIAVTKERGEHPLTQAELPDWIWTMLHDEYYSTHVIGSDIPEDTASKVRELIGESNHMLQVETGLIFGTVAVRFEGGFVTTGRGKRELETLAHVVSVDHEERVVRASGNKPSLNAPLLARLFENPNVDHIVHYHESLLGIPTYAYAPPGTVRDSNRDNSTSFNIEGHGCMLLFDQAGRRL